MPNRGKHTRLRFDTDWFKSKLTPTRPTQHAPVVRAAPGGTVVFDFRLHRGRDGPEEFLGEFEGDTDIGRQSGLLSPQCPKNIHHISGRGFRTVNKNTKPNESVINNMCPAAY